MKKISNPNSILGDELDQLGMPELVSWQPVSGGCIANAGRAELADGRSVFVKQSAHAADQFTAEAAGLNALRVCLDLRVPDVLAATRNILILEWVETGRAPADFFRRFGKAFAALHRHHADLCGFDHDNYLGNSRQINTPVCAAGSDLGDGSDWPEFFLKRRLRPQVEWASSQPGGASLVNLFNQAEFRIAELLCAAIEPPALLHGDLWAGNFMVDENGQPVLIDPAVYFGHREADLAMTHLFGGFDREFYTAYEQVAPLQAGWDTRLAIYQLYHLLNHFNLFGGSYLHDCLRIFRELTV